MDEVTRETIARIWTSFGLALTLIFLWFAGVSDSSHLVTKYPRWARWNRFMLWLIGIFASAYTFKYGLMNEIFDSPNPLSPWMRVVIVLAYLAVWGYIIKRRSTLPSPKIPK